MSEKFEFLGFRQKDVCSTEWTMYILFSALAAWSSGIVSACHRGAELPDFSWYSIPNKIHQRITKYTKETKQFTKWP
jgi:hypothetical protein